MHCTRPEENSIDQPSYNPSILKSDLLNKMHYWNSGTKVVGITTNWQDLRPTPWNETHPGHCSVTKDLRLDRRVDLVEHQILL